MNSKGKIWTRAEVVSALLAGGEVIRHPGGRCVLDGKTVNASTPIALHREHRVEEFVLRDGRRVYRASEKLFAEAKLRDAKAEVRRLRHPVST